MSERGEPKPLTWYGKNEFSLARRALQKYWGPAGAGIGFSGLLYYLLIQGKL